jgi:Cu/Ag efflux protein CusF
MKSMLGPILAVITIPVAVLAAAVVPSYAQTASPAIPPPATAPQTAPKPAHLKTLKGEIVSVDEFAKTFTLKHMVDKKAHEITFSAEGKALAKLTKIKPGDHLKVTYAQMGERPVATTIAKG